MATKINSVNISKMSTSDIDEVIKLGLSTREIQTGTSSPQFYSKETLSKWVNSPTDALLVAKKGTELVGFSLAAYNPYSRDGYLHVKIVNENYRKEGIGSKLLEKTIELFKKQGCNHIFATVKPDNISTLNLLRKHGFEVGEQFNYVEIAI